jgi:hypothetical protein
MDINQLYPSTPIGIKSQNLLGVVKRRREIETYLTNLKIERSPEGEPVVPVTPTPQPRRAVTPPPVATRQVPPANNGKVQTLPATKTDTSRVQNNNPVIAPAVYTKNPLELHHVVLVLDKVDPVYVTEARNAFNRYNKEKYYNTAIEIVNVPVNDDTKLVVLKNYTNAAAAIEYIDKAKKIAASDIIPWLTPQKYSFMIITESNLQILQTTKDIVAYRRFLTQSYPDYFK